MIAPVADIAPRVIGLLDFPVDAFLGNSVWVVAIHCRGVDELGNHVFDKFRIAEGQGLPVLENITPVALVGEQVVAPIVFQFDRKLVPGPARVTMPATKGDGQVLAGQTLQLIVALILDGGEQLGVGQLPG